MGRSARQSISTPSTRRLNAPRQRSSILGGSAGARDRRSRRRRCPRRDGGGLAQPVDDPGQCRSAELGGQPGDLGTRVGGQGLGAGPPGGDRDADRRHQQRPPVTAPRQRRQQIGGGLDPPLHRPDIQLHHRLQTPAEPREPRPAVHLRGQGDRLDLSDQLVLASPDRLRQATGQLGRQRLPADHAVAGCPRQGEQPLRGDQIAGEQVGQALQPALVTTPDDARPGSAGAARSTAAAAPTPRPRRGAPAAGRWSPTAATRRRRPAARRRSAARTRDRPAAARPPGRPPGPSSTCPSRASRRAPASTSPGSSVGAPGSASIRHRVSSPSTTVVSGRISRATAPQSSARAWARTASAGPAGLLQQSPAAGVQLAGRPAAQLVDQQHLQVGLQHLVVVVGEPPVGGGGEELLPLELGQHAPRCPGSRAVRRTGSRSAPRAQRCAAGTRAARSAGRRARCGPGRTGSAGTDPTAR